MADDILTLGVDIGSTTSKCAVLKNGTELLGHSIVRAGAGTTGPERATGAALEAAGVSMADIAYTVSTGYGRSVYPSDAELSELSAHAIGASCLAPGVMTVIDIGGQDAKVLRLDDSGRLQNFVMNDKCAAGTGRFLDVMAGILELDVGRLGELDEESEHPASISSTCTVFAESEVISQLSKGTAIPDVIAGIHASVAVRTSSLARRLGIKPPVVMTGGVAQNTGVVRALERELGTDIAVFPLCQLCGAYGAAVSAYEKYLKLKKEKTRNA